MSSYIFSSVLFCVTVTVILGLPTSPKDGAPGDEDTLVLLHVLFRHGNRTPEAIERYPKDPYVNETYFPLGLGQLTNAGKQREYSIGEALAKSYRNFLGPVYYPGLVDARSTSYDRTKMSLELVLASLFKPVEDEIWDDVLEWQPIPFNYLPAEEDPWLRGVDCANFVKLFHEYDQSDAQQAEYEKYKEIFDYIADSTGLTVTDYITVYYLQFGLATEIEWGFDLPEWAKPIWPDNITEVSLKYYDESMATPDLKRVAVGYFIQKILDDTTAKISQGTDEEGRGKKLYLYSAHDHNLGQLLVALDVFSPDPHIPTYGSYLVLEVHQIDGVYGIKTQTVDQDTNPYNYGGGAARYSRMNCFTMETSTVDQNTNPHNWWRRCTLFESTAG